ncbi:nucleotidyltransferase family protein [Pandoraea sp. CB10b_02]|uniref:nucleotidyltransferase family protein n=1 Tax=Pandoraea sp. CB10b_02 TaxID=2014535 RepID=UPI00257C89BA|nr:nucleotidyltransferase family protein [Pandoraea sp. CB10b_02]
MESIVWRQALLKPESTIQDAIRNLDVTGLQIALIVDDNGVLLGTVTDGDVRRALLRGLDLNARVDAIMFASPLVVTPEMGRDTVLHLMRANKVHQLPVIDDGRTVVGLHIWDEIAAPMRRDNVMVIMAGGFGKRLRPYTEDCPKPMLPVAGKPMLEHIIERAKQEGFRNFVLTLFYLGHVIESHFGDGSKWDINIRYVHEETPLGTAGALSLLSPAPEQPFIVTNGDVLTDINYGEMLDFHLHHAAIATMAVRQHEWQHPFGVVKTEGIDIVGFEEKPIHRSHVNAGIYVLNPAVLESLESGAVCDMPTLFERLKEEGGQTIAYPMHEPWLDVGRPEDLKRANEQKSWGGA